MNASEAVGLGLAQGITLWTALVPRLTDVKDATVGVDDVFIEQFRHTERVAVLAILGVGVAGSALSHSSAPLISAGLVAAVLAALYEYSLTTPGHTARLYSLPTAIEG